ncbi:hypothetical protein, partial [Isoptericola sp. NPDC056134]|uniref:hypothetical protein n=1 Tax=Isoptericola sp. NPDC056134 TaxID=3345723 RepID=UPI0035ED464D
MESQEGAQPARASARNYRAAQRPPFGAGRQVGIGSRRSPAAGSPGPALSVRATDPAQPDLT